jgi:hypothetical protein
VVRDTIVARHAAVHLFSMNAAWRRICCAATAAAHSAPACTITRRVATGRRTR